MGDWMGGKVKRSTARRWAGERRARALGPRGRMVKTGPPLVLEKNGHPHFMRQARPMQSCRLARAQYLDNLGAKHHVSKAGAIFVGVGVGCRSAWGVALL